MKQHTIHNNWDHSIKIKNKLHWNYVDLKVKLSETNRIKTSLVDALLQNLFQRVWNLNWNPQLAITTKNLSTRGTQS